MTSRFSSICLGSFLLILLLLLAAPVFSASPPGFKSSKAPIDITADRLDIDQKKGEAVFRGKVFARQDKMTLSTDTMTVIFTEKDNEVKEIIAAGSVIINLDKKKATCATAHFYTSDNKVVLTGKPQLREGKNIIEGEKIIFFLNEERSIVEGKKNSRVKTTIFPGQKGLFKNK
ncbi:MAG: lipopolysaccharide transport periplasmic protein LptA [Deltaproteobacteria bacterium]|nr:MAG: lipopolysaccharide transport periplasmic protein LptA [Deltaproteobacteria bacterium]